MNIEELKSNETEYEVKITLAAAELKSKIDSELATFAKKAKIPGFRPGKAPVSLIKDKYHDSVLYNVTNDFMNQSINDLIKEKDLRLTKQAEVTEISNEEGKDFHFICKMELQPKVNFPDFKTITIERPELEVTEDEIVKELEERMESHIQYDTETKKAAKKGDQVTIDSIGYVDGEAFEGGKLDAFKIVLGSNRLIPGFEDQLIGKKAGEEVDIQVTFPADYHAADLAGKPAEFKSKVIAVHVGKKPELNDEFAQKFKCDTVDLLKDQIKNSIRSRIQGDINALAKIRLFDQLEHLLDFAVPDSLLENEKNSIQQHVKASAEGGKEPESMGEDSINKIALRRVRIGLLLAEYAAKNNMEISEEELNRAIFSMAMHNYQDANRLFNLYRQNKAALRALHNMLLEEKAVSAIIEKEINVKNILCKKDDIHSMLEKIDSTTFE